MKSKGFRRYLSNTSWLLFSKIYRMGLALLLTVLMARYLGPEDFGLLSYALSLVTLFSVLITLGLESLVVKEVLSCPEEQEKTIASSIALRSLGCVIFIISVTVVVLMLSPGETTTIGLVAIISTGYLFKVFEVIRYWFEAHVQAKYSAGMELIAFTFSIILKVVMIILNAPLIYFSIAVASEFVIMSLGLLYLYLSNSNV
ncbi:oligosaccharide flippase family protein, partial [Vibrio neonatus]